MKKDRSKPSATLLNKAADAIEETVLWHAVGLSLGPNQGIGTGSLVKWNSRKFVVTARHNFRKPGLADVDPKELGFLLRSAPNVERVSVAEAMARRPLPIEERSMFRFKAIHLSNKEDLAAIEIDESDPRWNQARFFSPAPEMHCPKKGTVCIAGFPAGTAVHLGKGIMAVFPRVEWTSIDPQPRDYKFIRGYDTKKNFLVEWVSAIEKLDPHGMSGGIFWRKLPTDPKRIWTSTDIEPVGICLEYVRDRKSLKGIKIERVLEFLNLVGTSESEVMSA
jgi:hypothetical protein